MKEDKKRDTYALYLIQPALHWSLFSSIAAARTAKEAWKKLQRKYQGATKVMAVRLQTLRQSFENLHMKSSESIQDYIFRVVELANQMQGLGDTISESMVVGRVMRSLGPKYNYVIVAIEEAKDRTKLTMDELSGSLRAHEARLLSQSEQVEEQVLHVRSENPVFKDGE